MLKWVNHLRILLKKLCYIPISFNTILYGYRWMKDEMPIAEQVRKKTVNIQLIDDTKLVKRFKNGDETAFDEIVQRHQSRLMQAATILLGNKQDAMDIVQEVFVKVYFKLHSFRENSSLYTWFYRILYNQCISLLRRKKIVSFVSFYNNEDEKFVLRPVDPAPDELYKQKEIKSAVNEALGKLPLRQRTAFIFRQLDGLKYSEISSIMSITEGAAKASYFHAIQKLQKLLKHYGDNYGM